MMKLEERTPHATSRLSAFIRDRSVFLLVFVPLSLIYVATANLSSHNHIDPLTNTLTAWYLGVEGTVVLDEHAEAAVPEQRGNVAWIVESPRGPVSQYPPGAALLAAPAYLIWGEPMVEWFVEGFNNPDAEAIRFPLPSAAPATVVAALATAAAMGLVAASIPYAGGSRINAIAAGYVGGLATTMWATASDALWQHGPAAMWIALGIYLVARNQLWWSGLAFGAAVLTRPPAAVIAAAVGLYVGLSRKSFRPVVSVGAGSLAGLAALLWYNWWLWSGWTVSGGYGSGISDNLRSTEAASFAENVLGAFLDPERGLLVYAPFLLFLIPGVRSAWRQAPDWARAAALGAVVYLGLQFAANRFSGGSGFLGYRYPLEPLTAAGVILALSFGGWAGKRPIATKLFWLAVAASLIPQLYWKIVVVPVLG